MILGNCYIAGAVVGAECGTAQNQLLLAQMVQIDFIAQ